jgi:hypothetical protein
MMEMDERYVRQDRLRYTKNTVSSRLAILAILFDVLFFVSIYKSDVGSWYYTILIGASILYNLVFMLLAFLSSEGVKRYKPGFSWLLIALGAIQVVRIFILPMSAHRAELELKGETVRVMGDAQFIRCVIYLCVSSAACIAAAVINLGKSRMLKAHLARLGSRQA